MRAANPAVVYLSVTSHGPTGPLRNDPGYDPLFQARSGLMSLTGEPEGGPVRVGGSVVDLGTGVWAAAGVMGALMERERTGKGRHVTAALLDTALALVSYQMTGCLATGEDPPRMGTGIGMIAPYQAFPCRDGGAVMIAGGNDRVFVRLCKALGVDDLAARPEYAENAGRVADRDRLAAAISERTRRMSADALLARLRERRVPAAPIHTVSAAAADPQTLATGMLRRTGHPRIDEYVDVALPLRWDGSRAALRRFPPRIGEHQAEVLEGDEGWPAVPSDAGRVHAVSRAAAGPGERASAPQAWPRSFRTEAVGQLVATAAALGTRDPELVGESLAVAASGAIRRRWTNFSSCRASSRGFRRAWPRCARGRTCDVRTREAWTKATAKRTPPARPSVVAGRTVPAARPATRRQGPAGAKRRAEPCTDRATRPSWPTFRDCTPSCRGWWSITATEL